MRPRWIRHLPLTFGALSTQRVPDDLFMSWVHPLRHNREVRRDLNKYLRNVPKPKLLLEWADQQRSFGGPVLIVWARDDKLMPPAHAERLAEHFQNTQLVWVDDSRTQNPRIRCSYVCQAAVWVSQFWWLYAFDGAGVLI